MCRYVIRNVISSQPQLLQARGTMSDVFTCQRNFQYAMIPQLRPPQSTTRDPRLTLLTVSLSPRLIESANPLTYPAPTPG